ncbi:MAG: hypothetical protein KBH99_09680 [Syntrophobacteraceae bacterium]|nr:hypothetical protein [Syntrophobacteraceae bacterium]
MIKMIIYLTHLLSGLGEHGIIDDKNAILEGTAVGGGQDAMEHKRDEPSPFKSAVVWIYRSPTPDSVDASQFLVGRLGILGILRQGSSFFSFFGDLSTNPAKFGAAIP